MTIRGTSSPPLIMGFRGGKVSNWVKIRSNYPKLFGKSSESLKCSQLCVETHAGPFSISWASNFAKWKNSFFWKLRFAGHFETKNSNTIFFSVYHWEISNWMYLIHDECNRIIILVLISLFSWHILVNVRATFSQHYDHTVSVSDCFKTE